MTHNIVVTVNRGSQVNGGFLELELELGVGDVNLDVVMLKLYCLVHLMHFKRLPLLWICILVLLVQLTNCPCTTIITRYYTTIVRCKTLTCIVHIYNQIIP